MKEQTSKTLKIIAKNLKRIRDERGLTIKDVSELTGIRCEYIRKIEQVKAPKMNLSKLYFLTKGLKVSFKDLLT